MDGEIELLGERIAEHAAHLDAATHRLLADLREFDVRGGWHTQGALSCAHWLAWRVGWDLVTARDRVRVARKLGEFPTVDDALRRGEVSYSKVRAILRVATAANETMLLEYARLTTASQLEKLSRKYALVQRHGEESRPRDDEQRRYVRRRDTDDGMVKIEAVLHPEEAELVWSMLDHAAKHLASEPRTHLTSDDSAETHGKPAAPAPSDAMCSSDGSSALRGLTELRATVAMSTPLDAACPSDDSAESREMPGLPADATSVPQETRFTGYPTGMRRSVNASVNEALASAADTITCPVDDSAESRGLTDRSAAAAPPSYITCPRADSVEPRGGKDLAATAAAALPQGTMCAGDDSAESRRPSAAATSTSLDTACRSDDSAESRGTSSAPVACTGDNAARSSGDTYVAPGPSLLDRLLAEGQALGGVEPARITGLAITASPEPTSGHVSEPGVLHQRVDATRRAFNRADALVSITQAYLRGDRPNRAPLEVMITIPASTLRNGTADPVDVGCMGDSGLSAEAARRLSCDAGVIEVIEDEHGVPLSVGRKRRTIAGSIKRALLKRDTACTFPGCTHRVFLEGHHIRHWADGGETSLMNTALLCSLHHRHVHEYGYAIEQGTDQRPQFRDPGGRLVPAVPAQPNPPDLGWPQIRAANGPLAIDANTLACEWDGSPVNYGAVVSQLVVVDGLT